MTAEPLFFATAGAFGAWLDAHGDTAAELTVGFYRTGSGRPSLTWPESVDEALCHGWIDGVRRRIDDAAYAIRFTHRRKGSIWSAVNVAKAEALLAEGRMRPAGRAAFAQRIERKTGLYSYEQEAPPALTPAELRAFRKDKAAWAYFQSLPPGYVRTMTHWIVSTKQAEARARRLARFVASCAAGERLLP
jgi:uncharacterized protein YdeI (YjbR/CyaY-like superfamily)